MTVLALDLGTKLGERWAPVPGFSNYEISDLGNVRRAVNGSNRYKGAVLRPFTRPNGYKQIVIQQDGKRRRFLVHCLVAKAFLGPEPPGSEVAHGDGNRSNNSFLNLSWKTHLENEQDKILHGTLQRGENVGTARLTNIQVSKIKAALLSGTTQTALAVKFGVHFSTINLIANGRTWRSIEPEECHGQA